MKKKEAGSMREETEAIRAHCDADPQKEWDRLRKKHVRQHGKLTPKGAGNS